MTSQPIPDWLDVSRETAEKLEQFSAEVQRWNPAVNLVSKASVTDIWQRHVLDSAQILALADPTGKWADFGSGGGFPGIVMSIMGATDVTLIESDQRKATFLRQVAHTLSLPVTVLSKRIDQVAPLAARTISARALAPLTELLGHAARHLAPNGRAIFLKGRGLTDEISAAQQDWTFDYKRIPSRTDSESAIIQVENIRQR